MKPISALLLCPAFLSFLCVLLAAFAAPSARAASTSLLDSLRFGAAQSEAEHSLIAANSDTVTGGLGESARRLLPPPTPNWEGGRLAFRLKVDPAKPNYFTVRLWGGESSDDRLLLFCEGKQIGYRHLGEIDYLDFGNDSKVPPRPGCFFYKTIPLPPALTQGKTELACEIRSMGRLWGYGMTFEQYQKNMTEPTRGIYKVYTHMDGFFLPPSEEKQGAVPVNNPVRTDPGPEVLTQLKERVNREVSGLIASERPMGRPWMQFLARAYFVSWTSAYHNPKAVEQVVRNLDLTFAAYRQDPKLAQSDPTTWNADWFGLGMAGQCLALLAEPIQPLLDDKIDDGNGGKISRRAAYSEMLVASRDWHRENRRQYTNQSMINDLYGIYLSNRGLEIVDPARALPENKARAYLYESLGLSSWLGSDKNGVPTKPLGDHYWQLTDKGLTKELGFVGYYGEVLDWVTAIYDATRPAPDQPGDPKIRAQVVKIVQARAPFRYAALDAEGNRAMRAETIVGWRDDHYPGDVTYAERPSWDGSSLYVAAATLDPVLVGAAQQMFGDNQFFASLRDQMKEAGFRSTAGLLDTPDQYALLKSQPTSPKRLPMTVNGPDFAWADEEDGVLAIKHGPNILYASLYWRAREGINHLARVHFITPRFERIAIVHQEEQFEPSGLFYTRPDEVNAPYLPWLPHYPGDLHSAHAGERLPVAKIPSGIAYKPGEESPYAGRADFYSLRYGPYLIGMIATAGKTFTLPTPAGLKKAPELMSGKTVSLRGPLRGPLRVGPMSTVVLFVGSEATGQD